MQCMRIVGMTAVPTKNAIGWPRKCNCGTGRHPSPIIHGERCCHHAAICVRMPQMCMQLHDVLQRHAARPHLKTCRQWVPAHEREGGGGSTSALNELVRPLNEQRLHIRMPLPTCTCPPPSTHRKHARAALLGSSTRCARCSDSAIIVNVAAQADPVHSHKGRAALL